MDRRPARWLPRAALAAALLLGFAAPAQASVLDWVVSWFGATVRTEGLAISWNGTITARRIVLRDAGGTWASLDGVTLRWSPLRLLRGALDVSALHVRDATLERLPRSASPSRSASGGQGGSGLPERLALRDLLVQRLTLAPPVAGTAVAFHIEGTAQRRAADDAEARLLVTEIGGPARYQLQATLAPSGLQARLTAREPPGGPLARLAGLPQPTSPAATPGASVSVAPAPTALAPTAPASAPPAGSGPAAGPPPAAAPSASPAPGPPAGIGGPLMLVATANGPLAAVTTEASLTLGVLQTSAHGTVDLVHRRLDLELSAAAPSMAPVPGVGWTDARLSLRLSGTFAAPEAAGQLDIAGLAADGVQARALALHLAAAATALQVNGQADGVRLPGPQPGLLAQAPVRLAARMLPQAAGHPVDFTLDHPLLEAQGHLGLGTTQTLALRVAAPDLAPFAALAGAAAQGNAGLTLTATRTAGMVRIALDGRLGLTGGPAPAVAALGPETTIAAGATYAGTTLNLTRFRLAGGNVTLEAHGAIAPARIDLTWQVALPRLAPLNPQITGHLDAAGRVLGPEDDLALTADLSGAIAPGPAPSGGSPAPAPGGFTAHLALAGLPGAPHGSLDADGEVLGAPLRLALDAARAADGTLTLAIQQAAWKSTTAGGRLQLSPGAARPAQLPTPLPTGEMHLTVARLADFAPLLGRPLAGSLHAELQATADRMALSAEARGAALPGIAAVDEARLRATLAAPASGRLIDAQLALAGIEAGGIGGTLRLDARGPLTAPALRLAASVPHLEGAALDLTAAGRADVAARSLTLATFDARWHDRSLRLLAPTQVALAADGGLTLAGLRADLAGGTLTADGKMGPGSAIALTASLQRLPASLIALFAPSLPAAGQLSAEARLSGTLARPLGTIAAQGGGLRLLNGPGQALPPAELNATATLAGTTARLASRVGVGSSHLALDGTIGGPGGLAATAPLALRAEGTVALDLANPLLAASGQRVGGQLALNTTIGGTLAAPKLGGGARLSAGEFRDEVQGVYLRDLAGQLVAAGDSLRIVHLTGHAGTGTVDVDGTLGVLRPGLPVALRITAQNARPLTGGIVTADLDADIALRGRLYPAAAQAGTASPGCGPAPAGAAAVARPASTSASPPMPEACAPAVLSGTVHVRRATIRIPNQMPASVQTIPVRYAGAAGPATAAKPAAAPLTLLLALQIDAPQEVFVRGRGLNAELGGSIRIGGSLARMQPSGGFRLIRGTFNLVGQTLTFTSGDIGFNGGSLDDPTLNLVASVASGDTLTVGGTASAPRITLSSPAELPQDEILAQLLFHTGAGNLSPLQLASVAAGLAELSGGAGVASNPLNSLRGALGLDQLGVGSGASGSPTLQAGRYIGRRLYVGAQQGTGQQSTQGTVTYDLTQRLQLRATAGTGEATSAIGASGQSTGESVGIRYRLQY